ncbi:MAG: DegV family protein [Lachnospiraceae bacterium]
MSYRIVGDSCCEIPAALKLDERLVNVAFGMELDGEFFTDDENFDQMDFIKKVAASKNVAKSSCPSPEAYLEQFQADVERVYVIALSSHLSGSYNSAVLAKALYEETHDDKQIFVLDSLGASSGETLMMLKLMELEEMGLSFEEITEQIVAYRDSSLLFFVLDDLETLRKNGRLTGLKAVMATTLKIKPITYADNGVIEQCGQAIGSRKALAKMVDTVVEEGIKREFVWADRKLVIAHCNCPKRALLVKDLFEQKQTFKDVVIQDTGGLATMYANDGGIIICC